MSELKWPSEEEVRKMFAKKEGFGSDATLSAAMELPEVRALVEAARWAKSALAGLSMDEASTAEMDGLTAALAAIKDQSK